jgi:hypothetical protein
MSGFFGVKIHRRQPIVDAIRAAVAAKRRPVAARDRVYASEISGCDRRITFALLGCEPDAPRADSPSALLGDAIHMHLEALLVEAFPGRVETEVRVVGGAVSGRIDALLVEDDNTLTVIDIKTVSAREWATRSKVEEYVDQISIYAALVEAQTGVVLLVNRDTGEMEEMRFATLTAPAPRRCSTKRCGSSRWRWTDILRKRRRGGRKNAAGARSESAANRLTKRAFWRILRTKAAVPKSRERKQRLCSKN